jgi:integrase
VELVRVAAYAGLRRGELVALRWRDVDFVGCKMIVRRALPVENDAPVDRTTDPDGREVMFDDQTRMHLLSRRPELLDHVDTILDVVNRPDLSWPT